MHYFDTIICDRCIHYEVHPSGCSERCHAVIIQPFSTMLQAYALERMNGYRTCKHFTTYIILFILLYTVY